MLMPFSREQDLKNVLAIKLRRGKNMVRGYSSTDFNILHVAEVKAFARSSKTNRDYVELTIRIKKEFEKHQSVVKLRRAKQVVK